MLRTFQMTLEQNHLDKLWFTFSEEVIIKFLYFSQSFTKKSSYNFKDRYIIVCVKISYYHKIMQYISLWSEPNFMKIQNQ